MFGILAKVFSDRPIFEYEREGIWGLRCRSDMGSALRWRAVRTDPMYAMIHADAASCRRTKSGTTTLIVESASQIRLRRDLVQCSPTITQRRTVISSILRNGSHIRDLHPKFSEWANFKEICSTSEV